MQGAKACESEANFVYSSLVLKALQSGEFYLVLTSCFYEFDLINNNNNDNNEFFILFIYLFIFFLGGGSKLCFRGKKGEITFLIMVQPFLFHFDTNH